VAAPFYILFAGRSMALDGKNLGLVSLAFLGADTVTNLGWGLAGDRFGFRVAFIASLVVWIAATGLLMAAPTLGGLHPAAILGLTLGVHALIFIAFFGLGAAQSGFMMSSQTMVLEFGARDDMAMRLALTATAQGAMSAIGPLAGGVIAAVLGYQVLFGVSIGFLAVALIVLVALVEEPRFRDPVAPGADGVLRATIDAG
ncbi:MAG: MFS transporter, partial [Pseudomonadota bacterium]